MGDPTLYMADPRLEAWYNYTGSKDPGVLVPVDDDRGLGQRRSQAQRLREMGIHVPVPRSKTSYADFGKNLGKYPVTIGALAGMTQEEADSASESAATFGQFAWDYGSLPFYFHPATALPAGTWDISRGLGNQDPLEIALSMLGVAKPFASVPRAVSKEFEQMYLKATASLGVTVFLQNFAEKLLSGPQGAPLSDDEINLLLKDEVDKITF
jgi:hypothetical protein